MPPPKVGIADTSITPGPPRGIIHLASAVSDQSPLKESLIGRDAVEEGEVVIIEPVKKWNLDDI